jgi:DNA-binding XRE family transcriptional regulator
LHHPQGGGLGVTYNIGNAAHQPRQLTDSLPRITRRGVLALLGICQRTIRHCRSRISVYFRRLRNYPATAKTLRENLWQKRVDLGLSRRQLAEILGIGVTDSAVEKWEKNQNRPSEPHRLRILELLGFDPAIRSPTGDF